ALGDRFAQWSNGIADPMRERLLGAFFGRLPKDADVLDLGCGPGLVWTGDLPRKIRLTGVDLSAVQLRAAQSRVPDGRFIRADMTTIDFSQASFDGVLALYSLNHLPAAAQTQMVETIGHWLRPNGVMLATFPTSGVSAWRGEWLGVPMFFGGQKIEEIRASMARADLEILADEEVDTQEPEGSARFEWILAAKPSRRGGG
ncbi:MAG TPA: class I SAM-dependent methyltransferase, partial [Aeromicrobium sp.]|nr:class I SAM-dependent methyltransferase [Aeromicrobium sp.]